MNDDTPIAYWLLLAPKDTPDATTRAWAERVRQILAPSAPGWDTAVVTAADDFKACAPQSRGRPDWGAWVGGIPARYGGLVVPLTEREVMVGRATSDILEAAGGQDGPHRMGFGVETNTLHRLAAIEANWQGDERPWKAWSRLRFEGWPVRAAASSGTPRARSSSTAGSPQVADFLARCDEVMEYAERVLSGRRGDNAGAFLDSILERIGGMRSWAEEHEHVTDRMEAAVENIESGVSRWEH